MSIHNNLRAIGGLAPRVHIALRRLGGGDHKQLFDLSGGDNDYAHTSYWSRHQARTRNTR